MSKFYAVKVKEIHEAIYYVEADSPAAIIKDGVESGHYLEDSLEYSRTLDDIEYGDIDEISEEKYREVVGDE